MHTHLLETLTAVAETGSIAAAGRRLNVSAAAVAERLKLLEDQLDAKLIGRSGRTVSLTYQGEAIVPQIKEILERIKSLKHLAHPDSAEGRLTIGATTTSLVSIVPGALREVARKYKGLELRVVPGPSDQLFERLSNKDIDCAVITQPPHAVSKSLRWEKIRIEPLVLVSSFDMPEATPREILESKPFIRVDPLAWTGQLVQRYLRENDINVHDLFHLDALETIRILVAERIGVSILPDWGIQTGPQTGIRKYELEPNNYHRVLGMLSPPISGQKPLVDILLRELRLQARGLHGIAPLPEAAE